MANNSKSTGCNSKPTYYNGDSILDEYITTKLSMGHYLDPQVIYGELNGNMQNLTRSEKYKNIQQSHRDITNAVHAYFYSNSIYIYNELEQFIIDGINRKLSKEVVTYTSFLDLGMGYLTSHIEVIKNLGVLNYEYISGYKRITLEFVIKSAFDYLEQRKKKFMDNYRHDWDKVSDDFMAQLNINIFGNRGNTKKSIGIKIRFEQIYHRWRQAVYKVESKVLRNVRENSEKAFTSKIKESLEILVTGSLKQATYVESILGKSGMSVKEMHEKLQIYFNQSSDNSYAGLLSTVIELILPVSYIYTKQTKALTNVSANDVLARLLANINNKKADPTLIYKMQNGIESSMDWLSKLVIAYLLILANKSKVVHTGDILG